MNLSSFLARASKDRVLARLDVIPVHMLESALEERQRTDRAHSETEKLDLLLPAAGVWMVVMGEEIWARRGEIGVVDIDIPGWDGLNERRWGFWMERLLFMSCREDLSLLAREFASEGRAVMARVA